MHKDISGVLTVSTCLLNHDRNSVSDFTETPPHRATCVPLYLMSPLPASDSTADNPHLEKKEHVFRDVNQQQRKLKVRVIRSFARLPVPPLHSMNIGYPHCEINNAF